MHQKIRTLRILTFALILIGNLALFLQVENTHQYSIQLQEDSVERSKILIILTLGTSGAACAIIFLRVFFDRKLRIARFKELSTKSLFSPNRMIRCFSEWFMVMLVPYPNMLGKKFSYFVYSYNVSIDYQYVDVLHLLSLIRLVYFGYYLVTLSKHWSSSALRIA